ncbi:efflux RND transporter periplasmic adaptor subunit [Bacillus sp. Marseille-P3661]|uniref:efflux RND transporter periplasmic adaptor subunit n=1 Tax=Bacillus sp. Marseille-P3661 TaxID=1936234 RepID=UPI0015E164F4|nr:efflux RND transporter periplasmic adaptor subunit [Bacillus sp. Marseille-P3661]
MKGKIQKTLKTGIVFMVASSIALAGCAAKPADQEAQVEKQTPVKVAAIANSALKVDKEIVGKMKADSNVAVVPKMAGELISLTVEKGDQVQKGQVIGKINDRDLRTSLQLQQAALEARKAALDVALADKKSAQSTLTNRQTIDLNSIQVDWEDAKKSLERTKALYESGAVSKVDYEAAVTREQKLKLQYEQAQQNIEQAEIGIEKAGIGIESAQAQVKQAEISVKQAQDALADAAIIATQSGEIVEVNAEVGDTVGQQSPLVTIVSLDPIIIEATVSSNQLNLFKKGAKINVDISVLNKQVEGVVSYISPVANQSGLYTVEAKINNANKEIKPGMIGKFVIDQVIVKEGLLVPTEAIVEQGGESKIYVVRDGRAVEVTIEVIESQTVLTAFKGDVKENEQVVIKGQNTLTDGNLVNIIEEGK